MGQHVQRFERENGGPETRATRRKNVTRKGSIKVVIEEYNLPKKNFPVG